MYCALLFLSYPSIVNIKGCTYSQIPNYRRWDTVKQTEVRQDKTKARMMFWQTKDDKLKTSQDKSLRK